MDRPVVAGTEARHAEGPERAQDELRRVAADAVALGDVELSLDVVDTSAAIFAGLGKAEQAATLLGTAEKQRELAGIPRPDPDQQHLDRFIEPARRSVSDEAWAAAFEGGVRLTVEEAISLATSHGPVSATQGP